MCTCDDLMKLWGVSAGDIADFMMESSLLAYHLRGNRNIIDLKKGLPTTVKPLNHIESEIRKNIVVNETCNEPIIIEGEINYKMIYRSSKEITLDEQIEQMLNSTSSSYRSPNEDEVKELSELLYESQPRDYYDPVYLYCDIGVFRPRLKILKMRKFLL